MLVVDNKKEERREGRKEGGGKERKEGRRREGRKERNLIEVDSGN
jgi:hypothetical protein